MKRSAAYLCALLAAFGTAGLAAHAQSAPSAARSSAAATAVTVAADAELPPAAATPAIAPTDGKETILIDLFESIREVPAPYIWELRSHVIGAFAGRGRLRILDAGELPALAASYPGTGLTTPEATATDLATLLATRAPEAMRLGARYLLGGAIVGYTFEHAPLPGSNPPAEEFKATFRVLLTAYDLKLGRRLPDEYFDLTATAPKAAEADRTAMAHIRSSLDHYIISRFKFETRILKLCPPDKKGRVRELYIHCGSEMGVRNGDLFLVYEETAADGVPTRQPVGRLRVNDASTLEAARCKVTKGDEEIARAFAAGRTLVCVSDGKAFGY